MDFKEYKFPATEVSNLISMPKTAAPPTEKQIEKAINILNKEYLLGISTTETKDLITVINKYADYSPNKASSTLVKYLCDIYTQEALGLGVMMKFQENSNRSYQVNGTKSESVALEILSRVDGIQYKKNTKMIENDFFIGKPDIVHENSIKEIKTIINYPNFMYAMQTKPNKYDQYQLQTYMDLADCDTGEIIYVATGLHPEEFDKYIEYARNYFLELGVDPKKIEKRVNSIAKNVKFDTIPDFQRIHRFPFKKNPEMIRFARKRVTFARNWLSRWHDKYNKIVALPNEIVGEAESI